MINNNKKYEWMVVGEDMQLVEKQVLNKFKIGDKVKILTDFQYKNNILYNEKGVITKEDTDSYSIKVEATEKHDSLLFVISKEHLHLIEKNETQTLKEKFLELGKTELLVFKYRTYFKILTSNGKLVQMDGRVDSIHDFDDDLTGINIIYTFNDKCYGKHDIARYKIINENNLQKIWERKPKAEISKKINSILEDLTAEELIDLIKKNYKLLWF